jgi:hypothetical protein
VLALLWGLLAVLALVGICVREPRNAFAYLRAAAGLWIALTVVALPLLLTR